MTNNNNKLDTNGTLNHTVPDNSIRIPTTTQILEPLYHLGTSEPNYNTFHPYLYHLRKIDWGIYGSLTWRDENRRRISEPAQLRRREDFNRLIKKFCSLYKLRWKYLIFYQTLEYGAAEQPHFHFLIGKKWLNNHPLNECCETLTNLWTRELYATEFSPPGLGTADIQPYNKNLKHRAVDYCLKREFNENGQEYDRYDFISRGLKSELLNQLRREEAKNASFDI